MDGLSAAASVVAVIQISSQIFDQCRTYYINVKDARKDIERLRYEITSLQDILVKALDLADAPNSGSLPSLKLICREGGPAQQCLSDLTALTVKMDFGGEDNKMRQFGLRALKWPLTSKEVEKALLAIERHKASFSLALTTDQATLSLAIKKELSEMRRQFEAYKIDDDREAIIQWLSTTDPAVNHHAACIKCQAETGKWLVDRVDYKEWKVAQNSLLWLYGIPGCGKTILSSTIIQQLRGNCDMQSAHAVAYFYFDFNTTSKQEVSHCISSIIAQLCGKIRVIPAHMKLLYQRSGYGKQQANLGELKETLFRVIENLDQVFIILDALDECRKNGERDQLLAAISEIKSRSLPNLHILTTSRRELDIEEALLPLVTIPAIPIEGSQVDLDIKLYISWQLATDKQLKKWPKAVKVEIEESLAAGANGMFRWVVCQLEALKRCLKVSLIRKELRTLPRTLDETYARLFSNIDQSYRQDAKRSLLWLAFSERPLQPKELAEAIVINPQTDPSFDPEERFPDSQSVFQILPSLVTVSSDITQDKILNSQTFLTKGRRKSLTGKCGTITLAHFSVKEYLVSDRIQNSPVQYFATSDPTAHYFIAQCCLEYILYFAGSASKSRSRADLETFPLLDYAARYWYTHINLMPHDQQKLLNPLILKLLLSESALSSWLQIYDPESPTMKAFEDILDSDDPNTALFYASDMGLLFTVQDLLNSGWDPNAASSNKQIPLHRAVIRGHQDSVLALLKFGADINAEDIWGSTPLLYAVKRGHATMVQILLRHGAKVNSMDGLRWGPLHAAAYYNFEHIAILLLESGAEVNAAMKNTNQTALQWAAWNENSLLLDLLVRNGADINAKNHYGETALHYAARHSESMLQYLLKSGADFEVQNDCGETPLYWAVTGFLDKRKATETLMTAGARFDVPILLSAKNREHEALHLLLSLGTANTESISMGQMALQEATTLGYKLCNECWDKLL